MIHFEQVSYTYPTGAVPALSELSLAIPAGQFCAVVGANGAGKTTLANAIAGFIPHFYHGDLKGSIQVDGKDTIATPLSELVLSTGLIFQNPFNQISGAKY